jgi:hypothetical protein
MLILYPFNKANCNGVGPPHIHHYYYYEIIGPFYKEERNSSSICINQYKYNMYILYTQKYVFVLFIYINVLLTVVNTFMYIYDTNIRLYLYMFICINARWHVRQMILYLRYNSAILINIQKFYPSINLFVLMLWLRYTNGNNPRIHCNIWR